MLDEDSDTLICSLDAENEILKGAIHSQDDPLKPLDFVRADKNLEARLLYPRVPDKNGKITYSCKKPEQTGDGLKTESIYSFSRDSSSISNLMKEVIDQKYGSIKITFNIQRQQINSRRIFLRL